MKFLWDWEELKSIEEIILFSKDHRQVWNLRVNAIFENIFRAMTMQRYIADVISFP